MTRQLNTSLGFYRPSFMRIHVGTGLSLMNLNTINDVFAESVYLHEYIHFIQDITTAYGLSNICTIVDYMRFANNHIVNSGQNHFSVPVFPVPMALDNVHAQLEFAKLYNGTGKANNVTLTKHFLTNQNVITHSGNKNVKIVNIEYTTNSGTTEILKFGALCVVESMAYLIERICYPRGNTSPDLPYSSAEKIVELIYPSLALNKLNILALCDACLKTFHPGLVFYETLRLMRQNSVTFSTPEDVYAYVNTNQPSFNFYGAITYNGLLQQMALNAISQLNGYFNDPYFNPVKDWLANMIRNGVAYRMADESFPLKIARNGKISVNATLADFKLKVGTPLVTNNLNETILYDPSLPTIIPDYSLIWAIDQIHSTFWGQTYCEMVGLCKKSRSGFFSICNSDRPKVDERCNKTPWLRSNDKKLCAYAQIWKHWGLSGKYPN